MISIDQITDSDSTHLDRARLEDFLSSYEGDSKEGYLYLACFASFPVILSSDIIYKIWTNFDVFTSEKFLRPPVWSVSQILYSSIAKEVGYDLYEIYPSLKTILLTYIKGKMGDDVIINLAYFMKSYVDNNGKKISTQILREAQKWNFNSYLKKDEVSKKIIELLGETKPKKIDLDHLLASVSNNEKDSKLGVVVNLAKGLQKYRKGDFEHSKDIIEILKKLNSESYNTKGYNIEVPKELLESLRIEPNLPKTQSNRIYALIIGINEYSNNPLNGCINDANSIENYLLATESEPILIKLLDEQATKEAIIKAFEDELNKAKENDTVLFYFAGNGTTTIYTDAKQNMRSDSLVCYGDTNHRNIDEFILSTQEIRYLFTKNVSPIAHKTTLYDCSFITDYSRRKYQKGKYINCRERGVVETAFGGSRKQFLSAKENISNNSVSNYTEIYACENSESAIEVQENGVFTKKLLEYLEETDGEISYNALQGRIRQELKIKYDQRPIIKTSINENELKNILFLNRPRQGTVGEVSFDKSWCLNLGSIHGVKKIQKVRILDKKNKTSYEVNIKNVLSSSSDLLIPENVRLIQTEIYQARLAGLELRELKIHVKHFNGSVEIVQGIIAKLLEQRDDHFILENDEDEADYTLHVRNEKVYITHPNETYRPIIAPFELSHQNLTHDLISTFRHLCKYHYIKYMEGDHINVPINPLSIEVFYVNQQGLESKVEMIENKVALKLEQVNNEWEGNIKIKLKNNSSQKLYVCVAYMDNSFQIDTVFLSRQVQLLEPNSEVFLQFNNSTTIPISFTANGFEYNYASDREILKFIISNNEIDVNALNEKPLKRPVLTSDKESYTIRGLEESRKSLGEELNDIIFDEWTCQSLFIEFKNPEHNQISKYILRDMLTFDKMSDFALGIYYDVTKDKLLRPIYTLKPGIKLIDDSR